MKQKILLFTAFTFATINLFAQTEDFEGEGLGGTTFEIETVVFNTSGDLIISEFEDFSCDATTGTNRYLDSGHLNGASSGVLGSFAPADTSVFFKVSTTVAQCGWPGSADGEMNSTGTIRFTGTTTDDMNISEDFQLVSENFSEMVPFTFTDTIWGGIDLKSMEIEIVDTADSTDYFALDNLVFDFPVSTKDIKANEIEVFPNPTTGKIELLGIEYGTIQIIDNFGRIILKTEISASPIDISASPDGIYFIQISSGNQWITKKIIKI